MPVNMEYLNDYVRRLYPAGLPAERWLVLAVSFDDGVVTLGHGGGGCRVHVGRRDAQDYHVGMEVNLSTSVGGTNRRRRAADLANAGVPGAEAQWHREYLGANDSIEMRCRLWANVIQSPPRGISAWAALVDDTSVVAEPPKPKYREFTAAEIEAEPAW